MLILKRGNLSTIKIRAGEVQNTGLEDIRTFMIGIIIIIFGMANEEDMSQDDFKVENRYQGKYILIPK